MANNAKDRINSITDFRWDKLEHFIALYFKKYFYLHGAKIFISLAAKLMCQPGVCNDLCHCMG